MTSCPEKPSGRCEAGRWSGRAWGGGLDLTELDPLLSRATSALFFCLPKRWPVSCKPRGWAHVSEKKECWPRLLPPFPHLENEELSLVIHWEPCSPTCKKSLRKQFEVFLIHTTLLQLSFHLLYFGICLQERSHVLSHLTKIKRSCWNTH